MPFRSLLLLAAWGFACAFFPLTDTDIWWHLAAGRMIWENGIPRVDPFCQSSLGKPWIDLHWGFQLLVWGLWNLGGAGALVAAKAMAYAGAFLLPLLPHLHRRNAPLLAALTAFAVFHARLGVDLRPLAVTLLCLSVQYVAVQSALQGRWRRPWLALIPAQLVLVNMQGLFFLGPWLVSCLVFGAWVGRKMGLRTDAPVVSGGASSGAGVGLKPLAWTCLALWLCGFANPYGWKGVWLPFSLLGRILPAGDNVFSREIAENIPWFALAKVDPGAAMPFLLIAILAAFSFHAARRRFGFGHLLVFVSFLVLGLMAQRNLPLFALAAVMVLARNLHADSAGLMPAEASASPGWKAAGWVALLAVPIWYAPKILAAWRFELPGSLETPFRFPSRAVEYLRLHPPEGNLFNELRFGGYLSFHLHPRVLPFVDGRMILHDGAFYREFLEAVDIPGRFAAYRRRHGFTHALLPIGDDKRYVPLLARLLREEGWGLVHADGASALVAIPGTGDAVLELDSVPSGHPLRRELAARFGKNPRLLRLGAENLAGFLAASGQGRAARDLLAGLAPPGVD